MHREKFSWLLLKFALQTSEGVVSAEQQFLKTWPTNINYS